MGGEASFNFGHSQNVFTAFCLDRQRGLDDRAGTDHRNQPQREKVPDTGSTASLFACALVVCFGCYRRLAWAT